eukprot:jgi/Psemu1/51853/gm1.51853_g
MEVTEDWLAEEEEPADIDASFRGRREEGEGVAWVGAGREPDAEERAEEEDREGVDWSCFLGEEAEERPSVAFVGGGMLGSGGGEADEGKCDNTKRTPGGGKSKPRKFGRCRGQGDQTGQIESNAVEGAIVGSSDGVADGGIRADGDRGGWRRWSRWSG